MKVLRGVDRVEFVIEMLGIRKEFPGIVANDNITLQVKKGRFTRCLEKTVPENRLL